MESLWEAATLFLEQRLMRDTLIRHLTAMGKRRMVLTHHEEMPILLELVINHKATVDIKASRIDLLRTAGK